ncbi:MAG: transcription-repair coupling factor [Alphaproteobacteria bacterium]|nr:transcription-repair coupling factor [Alphaproteobacteria bacterium]
MDLARKLAVGGRLTMGGAPDGQLARLMAATASAGRPLVYIARDGERMALAEETLAFFEPNCPVLSFPAWDCLPYDRVSPRADVMGQRVDVLTRLASEGGLAANGILLTTVNAFVQRVPPRSAFQAARFRARAGGRLDMAALLRFLEANGYQRADTVMEAGEYAIRGGIVDVFPPGTAEALRLDLFGDELEGIRSFDPLTQRSTGKRTELDMKPVSEILLDRPSIDSFRTSYRALFGAVSSDDGLYQAVSSGRRYPGMEHWLALFHPRLETLLDYLPAAAIMLDGEARAAGDVRLATIADHYAARASGEMAATAGGGVYRPVPPERFYLDAPSWDSLLADRAVVELSAYGVAGASGSTFDAGGRAGLDFALARARPDGDLYGAVGQRLSAAIRDRRRALVAAYSPGSRDRLAHVLGEHGIGPLATIAGWSEAAQLPAETIGLVVLGLEHGFTAPDLVLITEQDILGERLVRRPKSRRGAERFLSEVSDLAEGDLVVHLDHGIGRYEGLNAITVDGAPHDCLKVVYAGDDRLFVPVENIEVLSRYGSEDSTAQLDHLGGVAWQARKAKLNQRIREMAGELIRIAAERSLRPAAMVTPPEGIYDEFCARFPFPETEDQLKSIEDVLDDLGSGRPMDRLICGDVGFGKTEVALRAAFIVAMSGLQVAVVVPTTLLSRQHFATFQDRFQGLPLRVAQLSRLVTAKDATRIKGELADGRLDIVIGTHALLAKSIRFQRIGLLVVDEEQHFGVAHKERLKQFRADVHVLTLTATPIPRTLQMALTGVREMSIIATPPVDRLTVRTFVGPYDPLSVREAIQRERLRGGQVFYVCPRIRDLAEVHERVTRLVPEARVAIAHGQLAPRDLEAVMAGFYDHAYDVLISTNIVESGLDIPTANTLLIHRADRFGLAQLYQLRGRIGRGKVRAYAYLTLPPDQKLTRAAEKRLHVLQSLDTLGAGFTLASHDLDIRGAGNLLGDEQSGHIREVGIELYQRMLEDAVASVKLGDLDAAAEARSWTPQISIGTPVLIPEDYVGDLAVRLGLYRRIATLEDRKEIEGFAAELIDRFGPLPEEVDNLLEIVAIKRLCRRAGVEKLDAGPKGAIVAFRKDRFANPEGLVEFLTRQAGTAKLRPDHRLVLIRVWEVPRDRLGGVERLLTSLVAVAEAVATVPTAA